MQLTFREIKEQVVIGLASRELSNYLLSKVHSDVDDLFRDATDYERVSNARRSRITERREPKPKNEEKRMPLTATTNQERQQLQVRPRGSLRCYNCSECGHGFNTCQKPRRARGSCYQCGSTDHQQKDCPQRAATPRPAVPGDIPALLIEEPDTTVPYVIPVNLEINSDSFNKVEITVDACLDTGSPISFIKASLLPENCYKKDVPVKDYCGVNKSKLEIVGLFDEIVKINNNVIPIVFHVVSDSTMAFPALLGRNFTKLPGYKIALEDNIVRVAKVEQDISDLDNPVSEVLLIEPELEREPTLNINPNLDFCVQKEVRDIVSDYLTRPKLDKPEIDFECKIIVEKEQPFAFRPRKLSFEEKNRLEEIIDDLLRRGIIRESYSPYCSPIVLLKKKNGKDYRLCVDFRELNKITVKDHFPLPLIEDQLDMLRDKQYFTCLDLKSGFHHIKLTEESIKYTSFVTQIGQYEYLRVPFGISNGPSVFCRFINKIFRDLIKTQKILVYMDDIMIATHSIPDHLSILIEVLDLMARNLLVLRLDKCSFMQNTVLYLGYLVTSSGIQPNPENVRAVKEYTVPDSAKKKIFRACILF